MRIAVVLLSLSMSSVGVYALPPAPTSIALSEDSPSLDTPFAVNTQTQIPGKILKPGNYTINVKDHLSDRVILQVLGPNGKVESTFLGVFQNSVSAQSAGPVRLSTNKGGDVLRGFTFPGGRNVEFVYAKADAASITSRSSEAVLAIDPPSDNLRSSGSDLSKEDAQIVTLWSLQATRVSGSQNGIAAKKYVSPQVTASTGAGISSKATAASYAAQPPTSRSVETAVSTIPSPAKQPAPKSAVAVNRRPSIKSLPHTASNMPILFMVALSSLCAALFLRLLSVSRER